MTHRNRYSGEIITSATYRQLSPELKTQYEPYREPNPARDIYNRLLDAKFLIMKLDENSYERFLALQIINELIIEQDTLASVVTLETFRLMEQRQRIKERG